MARLRRKLDGARGSLPQPEIAEARGAKVGLVAYGSSHWALLEARDQLGALGLPCDYLRVRALPLSARVHEFVAAHERIVVVEQNRDGQLADRLRAECPQHAERIESVLHFTGLPLDAQTVIDGVLARERPRVAEGAAR